MINTGFGNYAKLIAFFLVAVLLIVGFGFASEGWWQEATSPTDKNGTDNTPGNKNDPFINTSQQPDPEIPEIKEPEFINFITGIETSEQSSRKRHFAFVLDPASPVFGIAGSDLIAEFPTESGDTRILAFNNELSGLSKIGSLAKTRAYISNVARFFSSIIVSSGNDGTVKYDSCSTNGAMFDMSAHSGYYYTEYSQFTYTNGDLLSAGIYNANINTTAENDAQRPYDFVKYGSSLPKSGSSAKSVIIPFSQKSETELYYSAQDGLYSFNKNGTQKNDMLNDKRVSFKNVFVLFADTVTYEASNGTELFMNTVGEGSGYYITDGVLRNISWKSDASGELTFFDSNGERLVINRGNSYIGFTKSSKSGDVKIS